MQADWRSIMISFLIWSFIVLTLFPLFLLYFALWLVVFPFDSRNVVTHYFTFLWTRVYLTCNPGWKLRVQNREKIDRNKNYIMISNHQSIIDIALLLQLRVNFKWVSKIELAKVPFVGWVIWLNNHILVKRGDKASVMKMAAGCKKILDDGISVFIFPEGTRTENGELQPFKEGAFILAKDNHIPILPIILDGPGNALPKKGILFKTDQTFTVRVLDEIPISQISQLSLNELIVFTERIMSGELKRIRYVEAV